MVGGWVVGVQGKNHNSSCSYEQAEPSRARAELVNYPDEMINQPIIKCDDKRSWKLGITYNLHIRYYLSQISSMAVLLTQSWSRLSLEPGNWPRVSHSTSNLFPPTLRKTVLSGSRASVTSCGVGTGLGPVPPISLFLDRKTKSVDHYQ